MIQTFPVHGMPPIDEPIAGAAVAKRLREARALQGDKPTAAGTRLRCSDANACSRKITFGMLKVPRDIALTDDALMAFRTGDFYHQVVQEALTLELNARCEVPVDYSPELSISGSADAVYVLSGDYPGNHNANGQTVVAEIKSMAGFGFDYCTGARRSTGGPGPKPEHLVQAGLYGLAPQIGAGQVHIIYLSKDRGTCAEWLIGVDDELPHLGGQTVRGMVEDELARLRGILEVVDGGELPKRFIPGIGIVEDPPDANSKGNPWQCRFCAWQPTCAALSSDRLPLSVLNRKAAA